MVRPDKWFAVRPEMSLGSCRHECLRHTVTWRPWRAAAVLEGAGENTEEFRKPGEV